MLLKPKVVDSDRLYKLSECGTSNLQPSRKKKIEGNGEIRVTGKRSTLTQHRLAH